MSTFVKDLAERAAKTFVQAFAAALVIPAAADFWSVSVWKSAVVGAVAAGVSAVTSLLSKRFGPDAEDASVVV